MSTSLGKWQRLDPRTVWAGTLMAVASMAAAAVPAGLAMLLAGVRPGWIAVWTIGGTLLVGVLTIISELIRFATTRYRVDEHRIERKVELLGSSQISLAIERVRNVEISADIMQRWLGIATLTVAGGESGSTRMRLQALSMRDAEELRARLLYGRHNGGGDQIASLRKSWVRYAPFSTLTFVIGALAYGALLQIADWFDAVPNVLGAFSSVLQAPWWVIAIVVLMVGTLVGIVGTVVVFFEGWWSYRLWRHSDRSLQLRRGLLVVRQTSFDGRRIRGITLHEPPGLRSVRGARLDIVAVGSPSDDAQQGRGGAGATLMPAAGRRESIQVAETVLEYRWPDTLRRHPPAARRRRGVRAVLSTMTATTVAVSASLIWSLAWWVTLIVAGLAAVISAVIAFDNARGLGHQISGSHVLLRKGSWRRRTDVLDRAGLIAWSIRRSPFQARSGLMTLTATSAGGEGWFRLPDVGARQAAAVLSTSGDVWRHLAIDEHDAYGTEKGRYAAYTEQHPRNEGKP